MHSNSSSLTGPSIKNVKLASSTNSVLVLIGLSRPEKPGKYFMMFWDAFMTTHPIYLALCRHHAKKACHNTSMRFKAKQTLQHSRHVRTNFICRAVYFRMPFIYLVACALFGSLYLVQSMNSLLYCYALAVLDVWKTSNRSFLESSDKSSLSKKDYPSSDPHSPGLKSCLPLDFLSDLVHILQEVADSIIGSEVQKPQQQKQLQQRKFVQDAILFMGERDEDGNDSGNPGLLQALRYEWTGVPDRIPPHMQREQKPGLAGDLENLCQLSEQRIRICRSRILTLNGKAKRAQLMKDDPK